MNHPKDYIGDGVYVLYDGFSIWLRANDFDNPTDEICLEPNVLAALNHFAERCASLKSVELNAVIGSEAGRRGEPDSDIPTASALLPVMESDREARPDIQQAQPESVTPEWCETTACEFSKQYCESELFNCHRDKRKRA